VVSSGGLSVQRASDWFDISRQAYYQSRQRQLQRAAEDQLLVELVQGIRQRHPRLGGRKLYHELQAPMQALAIGRGRDALFDLLRAHDLLVPRKRSRRRTTYGGLWRCDNLLLDLVVTQVNQAWVADITYLATEAGFLYLALLTDAYSRFIVGYDLSSSLVAEGSLRALEQALTTCQGVDLAGLIHHSDHGVQYSAWPYRERLADLGIRSCMGAVGNCYENALAERINGILKGEYNLDDLFVDTKQAQRAVRQAIWLYNYERPHLALDYRKPAQLYGLAAAASVPL
jgi:transposase InsO family protein